MWNVVSQFCDLSQAYQSYYFGNYNVLKVKFNPNSLKLSHQVSSSGYIDYDYKLSCLDDSLGPDLSATCRCNQETWEENYKEWQSPYCMATNRFKDDSGPGGHC